MIIPIKPSNDIVHTSKLWDKKIITYNVGGHDIPKGLLKHIHEWNQEFENQSKGSLNFRYASIENADIRINWLKGGPTNSYVGTDALTIQGLIPTMNLGFLETMTKNIYEDRIYPHELFHGLGFHHAQFHPDCYFNRDEYRIWRKSQGWTDQQVNDFFWWKDYVRNNPDLFLTSLNLSIDSIMWYPYPTRVLAENSKHFGSDDPSKINRSVAESDWDMLRIAYPVAEVIAPPITNNLICYTSFEVNQIRKSLQTIDNIFKSKL